MPFTDTVLTMVGLVEIELPTGTIRLCDGGFVNWPARGMFTAEDSAYGTIEAVESVNEAIADEAPGGKVTLLPTSLTAAASLFQPTAQGKPIRFWIGEVNQTTGLIIGTPTLIFDGQIDTITVRVQRESRSVDIEFMAAAEKLFVVREGNVFSERWHERIWPGEEGFEHMTGAPTAVPWGVGGTTWAPFT